MRDLALAEIQKQGRSGGLTGIEIVDGIVVAREEWTPANVSTCSFSFTFYLRRLVS